MKAPDNIFPDIIYIDADFISFHCLADHLNDEEIEYIRKDIHDDAIKTAEDHAYFAGKEKLREELLEWAKEEQMKSTTILADDWWQKVIDKLSSL